MQTQTVGCITTWLGYELHSVLTSANHVVHGGGLEGGEGVVPAGGEGVDEGDRYRHLRPVPAQTGRVAANILNLRVRIKFNSNFCFDNIEHPEDAWT